MNDVSGVTGTVVIADDVITKIAHAAALESDGVAGARGVKVIKTDKSASVELSLLVKFGSKVRQAAKDAQSRVKTAVETMTGLAVTTVDVVVAEVIEPPKAKTQ